MKSGHLHFYMSSFCTHIKEIGNILQNNFAICFHYRNTACYFVIVPEMQDGAGSALPPAGARPAAGQQPHLLRVQGHDAVQGGAVDHGRHPARGRGDWRKEKRKSNHLLQITYQVEVLLQRLYQHHLFNTYVPTLCLMLICQATLYFKKEHFKTNVPVTITTMLVMYTLYMAVSNKLPPTSYIKFIDVWLIFGLTLPFTVFILHVLIEHIPQRHEDEARE